MLKNYPYEVRPNEEITRFRYTDIYSERVEVPYQTMNASASEDEGFFDIEYPVRTEYKKNRNREQTPPQGPFPKVYTPFESDRVDFSCFISTPHSLKTELQTFIECEEEVIVPIKVVTPGAIQIWVNEVRQVKFEPFTKNHGSEKEVTLHFQQGINEVKITLEDLAERDCNYFFQLINLSERSLKGFIPITNIEKYRKIEHFLSSLYPAKDLFIKGDIVLSTEHPLKETIEANIEINPSPTLQVNEKQKMQDGNITDFKNEDRMVKFEKNKREFVFDQVETFQSAGLTRLRIKISIDGYSEVTKDIVFSVYDKEKFSKVIQGETIQERKQEALNYFSSLELEDINVAFSKIATNQHKNLSIYEEYRSAFRLIEEKGDCADFILAPMLAVFGKYVERLSEDLKVKFNEVVLDFRYWVDEPGNDVMWYFSENHALLFHVAQYLGGHLYPNDTFSVSGRKGFEQYRLGKERLEAWFKKFFKYGFSEWNSTTYLPIDFIGFFSLYLNAPDKDIKGLAKKALDYTFRIMAINYHGGVVAASYGRTYEHNLKATPLGELPSVIQIAWKKGFFNNALRAAALFALTDYEPPKALEDLLIPKSHLLATYRQGKNDVLTYQYKTKDYSIASVIDYKSMEKGHQQHILNISLGDGTFLWLNHPGEKEYSGGGRPSFWAGNGIMPKVRQHKNCAFLTYNLSTSREKRIHLYLPFWELDEICFEKWIFIRKGDSYLGVYFSHPYVHETKGTITDRAVSTIGEEHNIIIRCSSREEVRSFEQFKKNVAKQALNFDGEEMYLKDFEHGEIFSNDVLVISN